MSASKQQNYKDLRVWQEALELVMEVYRLVGQFPGHEQFGLTNQLRRAVVSVPANIAEGQGRLYAKEFVRHLSIARGSLAEVDTHLYVAERLAYIQHAECTTVRRRIEFIRSMIKALVRTLKLREQQETPRPSSAA